MTSINGYNTEITFDDIITDNVNSIDLTSKIELGNNEIDLIASNVLINGVPIVGGGVQNPMVATLDGGGFDINNVNALTVSTIDTDGMIMSSINTEFITPVQTSDLLTVQGGLEAFSASNYNDNNISGVNSIAMRNANCQSFLEVSSPSPTILNTNASAGFTIDSTGFFDIKKS